MKPIQASQDFLIRPFRPEDGNGLVELWGLCGLIRPSNDPRKDIARKLKVGADMFLVALVGGRVVGSVMAGYEGHRGWINYMAVAPDHRGRGYGRRLMDEAERVLRTKGCPKINLQVRTSNSEVLSFYRALGYGQDGVLSLGKRLENDQEPA